MEKILIILLLVSLPFQLGKHFWPSFSYFSGLKIDFLAPVIYLQDVLFLALFVFNLKYLFNFFKKNVSFLILVVLAFINILFSFNKLISLIAWIKIIEYILLGAIFIKNKEIIGGVLNKTVLFWILLQFSVGISQYLKQSSIGGIFWLLGERSFNIMLPGIARADFLGTVFLRPYGTFSHPNSLAGFILTAMMLLRSFKDSSINRLFFIFGAVLLIFCFSRTVWLTLFLICLFFVLLKVFIFVKKGKPFGFAYSFALFTLIFSVFLFSRTRIETSSFKRREVLSVFAFEQIKENSFFGVGLNNFILVLAKSDLSWGMASFLQPVHNIYLLIASETGLVGFIFFVGFLIFIARKIYLIKDTGLKWSITAALFTILFTGMFDHYWATLVQNKLLFVLVLSLSFKEGKKIISAAA